MLGGYQTVSMMDENIYQKIVNSNSKAILIGDIVIDGVRKNSVYVPITIADGVVIFKAYGKQYTIGVDNSIAVVDHTEVEFYYFASLNDVPNDLPEGSYVSVPSAGGMPVVELSTPIRVTTDSSGSGGSTVFSEADNALLENNYASFMLKGTIVFVVDGTDAAEIPFETIASYIDFGGAVSYTLCFFMLEGVVTAIINKDGDNWTSIGAIWGLA